MECLFVKYHDVAGWMKEQEIPCLLVCLQLTHDSVGKIGIDQLDQASSNEKRRVKQAEQAKAFPGQRDACRETQQACLYYT